MELPVKSKKLFISDMPNFAYERTPNMVEAVARNLGHNVRCFDLQQPSRCRIVTFIDHSDKSMVFVPNNPAIKPVGVSDRVAEKILNDPFNCRDLLKVFAQF